MHQFTLYGIIPSQRHEQVMSILAGVAATQPIAYAEQHLLYAPLKALARDGNTKRKPQASSNQRYYHGLQRTLDSSSFDSTSDWRLLIKEEPEAGNPGVISQPYTDSELNDTSSYEDHTRYRLAANHVISGDYIVHNNVVCKVFRCLLANSAPSLSDPPPSKAELRALDTSGAFTIEASVRIDDRKNSRLADLATKELLDLKRMLQGAVPLDIPDRLSLDTRIREGS